ncbi:MAG: helix-turn-helix domain-containing protein [Acidimicrobiales bacterium]
MHEPIDSTTERLLTVTEVAEMLRVSKMTVYRLVSAGTLPSLRVGRSVRIRAEAVDAYFSAGMTKAG